MGGYLAQYKHEDEELDTLIREGLIIMIAGQETRAMPFTRKKWYLLILGVILVILCSIFAWVSKANNLDTKNSSEKSPIRTLSIEIDKDQREDLFSQLRKFSEKHNLEFHLSFYENKQVFFVEMYGKGLEILALSKPVTTANLSIDFYAQDPANPPSQKTIDELCNDLKGFISEIPNVTITE